MFSPSHPFIPPCLHPQQMVEQCASKPSSPEAATDCRAHLSPEQLSQVVIGKEMSLYQLLRRQATGVREAQWACF